MTCPQSETPTRAALDVCSELGGDLAPGPTPGFSWVNGVALGLMLAVDVSFGIAWFRHSTLLGSLGGWWILSLYAAGLTAGVAVIRPSREYPRRFWIILSPIFLQILVYLAFWAGMARLDPAGMSTYWPVAHPAAVFAVLCFVFGAVLSITLPLTRRYLTLMLTEVSPLALLVLSRLLP